MTASIQLEQWVDHQSLLAARFNEEKQIDRKHFATYGINISESAVALSM